MGSNNSRLNGRGGEVLHARVRSRVEELRRKTDKKELNFDGSVDGGNSEACEENKGDSNKGSLNDIQQAKRVEKISKVVPLPVSEPKQNSELYIKEKEREVEKKDEKVKSAWLQNEEDDEDIESGRTIGPSSPSFKIYCREPKNKAENFPELPDLADDENQLQKSASENSFESFVASIGNTENSNEIFNTKSASKRKGKMKEAMKKNLLYVKHMNKKKPICTRTA